MPQTDSDVALIARYFKGDEEALRVLFERYIPAVFNFIARLTPSDIEAEDIVQEAFVKAWKNLKRFNTSQSFKTWIFTIAKRTLFDAIKKKRPVAFSDLIHPADEKGDEEIEIVDERPLVTELMDDEVAQARVDQLLNKLPEAKKLVVVLHVLEGLTFREIGEILEEPMETTKTRYRRGLVALKQLYLSQK